MTGDNWTAIILAVISLLGIVIPSGISLFAVIYAKRSLDASTKNAAVLETVHKAVNGLTAARIEVEKKLGDAHVAVARGEGRDEERAVSEQKAKDLLAVAIPVAAIPVAAIDPVEVKVIKTAPVKIEASIPLEIKKET